MHDCPGGLTKELRELIKKTQSLAIGLCENCGKKGDFDETFAQILCDECVYLAREKKK